MTSPLSSLLAWVFAHMSFLIPARRLRETDTLLAFRHPRPAYPFHVVLLPKKSIRTFVDLDPADPFLADLVAAAQSLVEEFHLSAYRLVVNGGENQGFPRLHFHLIADIPSHPIASPDGRGARAEG
jgi:histidine triad (HIT) family protein